MGEVMINLRDKPIGNIVKLISFILAFLLSLTVISMCIPPDHGYEYDSIRGTTLAHGFYGEPKDSLDVVAVGNSNIECAFSPMELWKQYGFTGYTCGEPMQSIYGSSTILSKVFTRQKPKVVILDVDALFPTGQNSEALQDFIKANVGKTFALFQYHTIWKSFLNPGGIDASVFKTSPMRGFYETEKREPLSSHKKPYRTFDADRINFFTRSGLDDFSGLCKQNGAQLVLTYVPAAHSWDQERYNTVARYASAHHLPYLDLNQKGGPQIDWDNDSRDGGDHLNCNGATKVTLYIGEYLHQHYSLPDHRKDPAFKRWNKDYVKYQEKLRSSALSNPHKQISI